MSEGLLAALILCTALLVLAVVARATPAIAQTAPKSAIEVFTARSAWEQVPSDLLDALANKLNSLERVTEFADLCERTGILKNNIGRLVDLTGHDSESFAGGVAATLTSYANTMIDRKEFRQAKQGLGLALLLKPRHVPAWSSMALASIGAGDCVAAVSWSDKVLSFKPDSKSKDLWERALANYLARPGRVEKNAAEALGEPDVIGTWEHLREQMKAIKDACGRR